MSSLFKLTASISNNTSGTDSTELLKVPLGGINIPNTISVGSHFLTFVKAAVSGSSKDFGISAKLAMDTPRFDTEILHFGAQDTVQAGSSEFNPDFMDYPASMYDDGNSELQDEGDFEVILEFNPALQMEVTIFGDQVLEGVRFLQLLR